MEPSDTKQAKKNGTETISEQVSPTSYRTEKGGPTSPKRLPDFPGMDSHLPNAFRSITSPRGNHTYGLFFLEYSVMAEYNQLPRQKLPGVYVVPSAKSPLLWHGVMFIRQGLYQEGVFKMSLHIPENYPEGDCPKLLFDPPVFHPQVDPDSGELDVKRAFSVWRRNINHIWHVLLYARRVFYKIETKDPLNPEAAALYEGNMEGYKRRVSECVRQCNETIYDSPDTDDAYAIRFTPFDDDAMREIKAQMCNSQDIRRGSEIKNAQTSGLSWMSPEKSKSPASIS